MTQPGFPIYTYSIPVHQVQMVLSHLHPRGILASNSGLEYIFKISIGYGKTHLSPLMGSLNKVFFRDGIPSLSSSYKIPGLVPVCWLLFQWF